ncbi:MAG: DASS family sodium-coupled anion symporter, partial [Candidatus Eisenbacteria bacterium]
RIALQVIRMLGVRPRRLILGFMIATAFLSLWISNTATTMLMLPIALSVIERMNRGESGDGPASRFPLVLMISIAYAASIGGAGTLIGTPPNISLTRIFAISFPDAPRISFGAWFGMALPLVVAFLAASWFLLCYAIFPLRGGSIAGAREAVRAERKVLGRLSREESIVLALFVSTAVLWITRADLGIGGVVFRGWASRLGLAGVDDATVAMFTALLLFLIPASAGRGRLMDWRTARRLPWGILLLFGGGFALASAFRSTGLTTWIGEKCIPLVGTSPKILVAAVSTLLTFLTELTSNTATTEMILPVLASIAGTVEVHPLLLMIPATFSASFAFMLPVATPPNAIVFGSGRVPMQAMVRAGIVMNLVGIVLVWITVFLLGTLIFDMAPGRLPPWM